MTKTYEEMTDQELLDLLEYNKQQEAETHTQQMAYKILLNSCYGAIGQQYFRHFDIRQAEAITLSGQTAIKWIENFVNSYLNSACETQEPYPFAVYMDTDSVYITFKPLLDKLGVDQSDKKKCINLMNKICEKLGQEISNQFCDLAKYTNSFEQTMVMARESLADKAFWTGKKRYALNVYDSEGVAYDPPHLKIMGLETARSSTPAPCREALEESIRLILTTDEKTVIKHIETFKEKFFSLNASEIATPSGISDLDKQITATGYAKGCPIHVRAAILHNKWIRENKLDTKYPLIKSGDKIKYVYLKVPNPIKENVFGFMGSPPSELGVEQYIDYYHQFDKTFMKPLNTIMNCIGWKTEHIETLESFFDD